MKPRHAAALALVGWYLMVPQLLPNGSVDFKAPLSQWYQIGGFDSAAACGKERNSRLNIVEKGLQEAEAEIKSLPDSGKRPTKEAASQVYEDYVTATNSALETKASRCVAGNDPGLKEKAK